MTTQETVSEKPAMDIHKHPDRGREVAVNIAFDVTSFTREQKEKLSQVQNLLGDLGISFDSARTVDATPSLRDWQWDWSLRGPVKVTFCNFVDEDLENRHVREKKEE